MTTNDDFIATFDKIKCKHDEAFHLVDNAIKQEEEDHPSHALNLYKLAVEAIDETLAIPVNVPENMEQVQSEWTKACQMIHKIKRARAEIVQRIGVFRVKCNAPTDVAGEAQPSGSSLPNSSNGEAAAAPEDGARPRTYSELALALREMQCTGEGVDALELLFSCEGVKLYCIKPSGLVTTALEHSILRIVRMGKDERKLLSATFFIQIIKTSHAVRIQNVEDVPLQIREGHFETEESTGTTTFEAEEATEQTATQLKWDAETADLHKLKSDNSWIYPLIPGVSPCFRTDFGAFILPDLEATEAGSSFGIVVPKDNGSDQIVFEILEGILHGVAIQSGAQPSFEGDFSERVSSRIVRGAAFVSQNLVRGAEKAGELMTYSTPYLISKIRPAAPDAPPVSRNVQKTVEITKNVSGVAAGITGFIAEKVGSATMALGRFLAPHIQTHGSTLLSKGFGMEEAQAQQKMADVLTIAAGAVEGFGTIYTGLEESAVILGKNLSDNSVKIIDHKYGTAAGSLAAETFDTVGNVINLTNNVHCLTPRGIAKRTAKNTGRAIVEDYRPRLQSNNIVPAGALYPDLSGLQATVEK